MPRNTKLKQVTLTAPIYLPASLIAEATEKLGEREIELETFVAIYLRMVLRSKTILDLEDIIPFGKYQGEIVEHIVRIDPSYVQWLITQDGRTKFKPDVILLCAEIQQL